MADTNPFDWADAPIASSDVTEPIDSQQSAGWQKGQAHPHNDENWLIRELGKLTRAAGGYDTLDGAADAMSDGDTGIVDEDDLDKQRGTVAQERTLGWTPTTLDVTGKSVVIADNANNAIAVDRTNITSAVTSYSPTLAGAIRRIISDGVDTVLIYGNNIELYDHDTGGAIRSWVSTPGGGFAPNDVAMDDTYIYVVSSVPDGVGDYVLAINRTTGAKAWGYNHGAALHSVCCDGHQVYVGGQSGAGANSLRALAASSGTLAWSVLAATVTAFTGHGKMATDGQRVYVGSGGTLYVLSRFDGASLRTVLVAVADTIGVVSLDQTWVWVNLIDSGGADARRLYVYDKKNLDRVFDHTKITGVTLHLPNWHASDGCKMYVASNPLGSGGTNFLRCYRGNRARVWMRVDPSSDPYLPTRQLMIPEEH